MQKLDYYSTIASLAMLKKHICAVRGRVEGLTLTQMHWKSPRCCCHLVSICSYNVLPPLGLFNYCEFITLLQFIAIDIVNDVYKYPHLKSSLPWKCYLFLSQHNTYLTCSRTQPTTFKKVQIHVSNKGILFIKVTKFRRITDHLIKTF